MKNFKINFRALLFYGSQIVNKDKVNRESPHYTKVSKSCPYSLKNYPKNKIIKNFWML